MKRGKRGGGGEGSEARREQDLDTEIEHRVDQEALHRHRRTKSCLEFSNDSCQALGPAAPVAWAVQVRQLENSSGGL